MNLRPYSMLDATQEAFGLFTVGSEVDDATMSVGMAGTVVDDATVAAASAPGTVGSEVTDATVMAVAAAPGTIDSEVNDATVAATPGMAGTTGASGTNTDDATVMAAPGAAGTDVDRLVAHMRACTVGRCRLTVGKPVLEAPMGSAFEPRCTVLTCHLMNSSRALTARETRRRKSGRAPSCDT